MGSSIKQKIFAPIEMIKEGLSYLKVFSTYIVGVINGTEVLRLNSDGILDLTKQSGCSVYLSETQNISYNSDTDKDAPLVYSPQIVLFRMDVCDHCPLCISCHSQ